MSKKEKQLLLNATTQEYELEVENPVSKPVRMSPIITIIVEKANNNEIKNRFDSINSYYEAINFLADNCMSNDSCLQEMLFSRKRTKEGDIQKRQNIVSL
jgi:hypothetical protein